MGSLPIRLWESWYPDTELIPIGRYNDDRRGFVSKVTNSSTTYYTSSLESVDAALALLAIGQISQSYLLFFQALEVSLKGLLDEYKADGLRAWMARHPKLAVKLASTSREELLTNIKEMTFLAAFRECDSVIDFPSELKNRVNHLNGIRNDIIHRGGDLSKDRHYLELIVNILLPLLDTFYQAFKSVYLSDFVGAGVGRELVVIGKYLKLSSLDSSTWTNCLTLFHTTYFNRWTHSRIAMVTENPDIGDGGDFVITRANVYRNRMQHDLVWDEIFEFSPNVKVETGNTGCRVCGSECYVSSSWKELSGRKQLEFEPQEVRCPNCKLEVTDPLLSLLHYGAISEELLGGKAWADLLSTIDGYKSRAQTN